MIWFVLGIVTTVVVSLLYYGIAKTIEERAKWNQVMYSSSSPSEIYWGRVLDTQTPESFDDEESPNIRIHFVPPTER